VSGALEPRVANERTVALYDRLARVYDLAVAPAEAGTRGHALAAGGPDTGDVVVEVGCGTGHALAPLARRGGPTGRVVGVDAAPGMLSRAADRVEQAESEVSDRIDLVRGDARDLPVPDGAADLVYAEDVLELFGPADLRTVLSEVRRVLGAGGQLCAVTMEREGLVTHPFTRAYEWAFRRLPGVHRVGCRPFAAREALAESGFELRRTTRHRRLGVWPVDVLVARPE
jgi:ubiquinone/menaquinone biosynthesis C-methylase UbiE